MNTVTITRRSKIGFGYTSAVENDEHGRLQVRDVTSPDYVGTIAQIEKQIGCDKTLNNFRSGGTYYRWAWFVKTQGKWTKIEPTDENNRKLGQLTYKIPNMFNQMIYQADAVTVTVL